MRKLIKLDDVLKEQLKDPEARKAYEEEGIYVDLAVQIAKLREKEGYSQKDLAKKLHTTQQTVSRLESSDNRSITLGTLIRLAKALHKRLDIRFV
jgi:ribosome-binding protein aMBF1 (putative translation factor)